MFADEDLHRHAVENLDQADALLFGRVTYEMMEAACRPPCGRERGLIGTPRADDRRDKEVRRVEHPGSGRLERETRARGLGKAVQQLQRESGKALFVGGVKPARVGGAGIDR
jgi:hypothetical protein